MENGKYYDGNKLLNMLDLDGNKPEIFLCTTNRTGGKTTYFSRLLVNRYLAEKGKFLLLYRFKYELDDVADKFFKDIGNLFFPRMQLKSKSRSSGTYQELFLNDKSCGYAVALNSADTIKRLSHLLGDVTMIFFDEFQSETNHYCANEIQKFQSLHTSLARGNGEQVRYLPVIMCSNSVSLINPYYVALGISDRLRDDTKFLKGHGFVLEQGFVESASNAQLKSGFNKAFGNSDYILYSSQNIYLNDNYTFIEKPTGQSTYVLTIKYKGVEYGIREYYDAGVIYCDTSFDSSYPIRISITTDDMNINYVMIKRNELLIERLRWYFEHGCFRFKNLLAKEAILKCLAY